MKGQIPARSDEQDNKKKTKTKARKKGTNQWREKTEPKTSLVEHRGREYDGVQEGKTPLPCFSFCQAGLIRTNGL